MTNQTKETAVIFNPDSRLACDGGQSSDKRRKRTICSELIQRELCHKYTRKELFDCVCVCVRAIRNVFLYLQYSVERRQLRGEKRRSLFKTERWMDRVIPAKWRHLLLLLTSLNQTQLYPHQYKHCKAISQFKRIWRIPPIILLSINSLSLNFVVVPISSSQ
jgi:hypothetical protein